MNDVPGRLRAVVGLVADRCWREPDLEDFLAWRGATLEYWVQMVFSAVAGRSVWSARGETPLITTCPAARARTGRKWADGAVIWPDGAGALVEIKAVPASKPAGMRALAADLAALAAVDWPATLALPGPDAGVDERWWQDRQHRTATSASAAGSVRVADGGLGRKQLAAAALAGYDPPTRRNEGGRSCTATTTPNHPFEPASKRRRRFPPVSLALSGAIASSASTPSSSRNSAETTCAHAARAAAFRRCCRGTGRFDGVQAEYYVRDQ